MGLREHLNPNGLRLLANRALRRVDLGLYRQSWIEKLTIGEKSHVPVALPEGAEAALQASNPRLRELEQRYRGHPAAKLSGWSDLRLADHVELAYFRGDNQYLYQARGTDAAAYALSAFYVRDHDPLGLLDVLEEDGAFGALTHIVEGRMVSRDLLDSVLEINYLAEVLGADRLAKARVLDIGAGYGRLAHRMTTWSRDVDYIATDAVPLSSFLCEYHLNHRDAQAARVVPLDEIGGVFSLAGIDLALNIHSFGEAPRASVTWWLESLAAADVPRLLIVHNSEELFTAEASLKRGSYDDVLARLGYTRTDLHPKYAESETVQRLGVFPAWYHLFER